MTKPGLSQRTQEEILYWLEIAYKCHIAALRTRDLCALTGLRYHKKHSSVRVTLSWLVREGQVRRLRPGWWALSQEGRRR